MDRQVDRQEEMNYYDLLLNEETARYIFRILALKIILEEPEKYGFYYEEDDLYKPLDSYEVIVDSSVTSFAEFAKSFNTNYKILRETYLTNEKGKPYRIRIPEAGVRTQPVEKFLNSTE